jgi:feruloyl-CoA synthase
MSAPRFRNVRLGPREVAVERRRDGTILLRNTARLEPWPARLTEKLDYWAVHAPDRVFLAQRAEGGTRAGDWEKFTYAEVREGARRVAQALLERGLGAERPVVVLSGNDIQHALIELGAMYAGIPYAPVSPAYSLMSADFAKLKSILGLLTPGLVYASLEGAFGAAIEAAVPAGTEVVFRNTFFNLEGNKATSAVDEAHRRVGPDTIVKFLFTSGSTGVPKAVINTQRMWCSNQEMLRTVLAFFRDEPPVIVDWAPWHHTAAGNHDFGLVLYNGGTYYIDNGKPMPGAIEETVRNLREVSPTWYFNVPKGFEALLPYLRKDPALRESFFRNLKVLWFAGAGLAQSVFDEYRELSRRTCGEEILFLTGLGSTETAPLAMARVWHTDNAGNMGVPPPGLDVKLVPLAGHPGEERYEMRLKGPNITPGYWRQPELTAQAFDEEGYYCLGDSFTFQDPSFPQEGLIFRGRISEDFKLATGTWVNVGPLRARFLEHCAPHVRDVVIAGEGRSELGALVFPAQGFSEEEFLAKARTLEGTGSSNRMVRLLVLEEPPSLDGGEITDKGTINQKAVLARRAALVDRMYRDNAYLIGKP